MISAILVLSLQQSQSKFHSTTIGLHPTVSPLPLWSTRWPSAEADNAVLVQRTAGAWDLTSDAQSVFHFFPLAPNQCYPAGQEPTTTLRSMVVEPFRATRIHAPSCIS